MLIATAPANRALRTRHLLVEVVIQSVIKKPDRSNFTITSFERKWTAVYLNYAMQHILILMLSPSLSHHKQKMSFNVCGRQFAHPTIPFEIDKHPLYLQSDQEVFNVDSSIYWAGCSGSYFRFVRGPVKIEKVILRNKVRNLITYHGACDCEESSK